MLRKSNSNGPLFSRFLGPWLIVVLGMSHLTTEAYVLQRDEQSKPLHISNTLTPTWTYHLGTSGSVRGVLSNEWVNARAAVGQWLAVPGTTLKFVEGSTVSSIGQIPAEDGRVDIIWVDPGIPYPLDSSVGGGPISVANSQVAVTFLFTAQDTPDVILQAIVLVRRDLDYTTSYTDLSANRPFLETVLLHELGHVLGANHSPLGTATLWWNSGGGANAAAGLSADEVAFAQGVYGTAATQAIRAKISGTVRLNGAPVLGAVVLAERTNGILVSATVSHQKGGYEFAGLVPGTFQLRVVPLDPPGSDDSSLVQGSHLDVTSNNEYLLANTGFQPSLPSVLTVAANSSSVRDFSVIATFAPPLRISGIRQGLNQDDLATSALALQLSPGQTEKWVGVYVPGLTATTATLRLSGSGLSYGNTLVLTNQTLRNMPLVQVPVSVDSTAPAGPRTLELTVGGIVIRANGFAEVLPAFPDDNFDGLNDLFQRAYWAPFTQAAAGPLADPDGDGYTNQREAAAGTDPLNAKSLPFRSTARISGGKVIVTETVVLGKNYQLYARDGLSLGWMAVGGLVVAKGEAQEFTDDRPLNSERYYQVRRLP